MANDELIFSHEKHVRYWLRHLKTYLPTAYQSMDSNRMFMAFMTVSALDFLGVLHTEKIKPEERADAVEWIYRCQHPEGGFRAFTGTNFGGERRRDENSSWDVANIAGTFFALASLVVLNDDLSRVDKEACLQWLRKLQAEDGSFAEILGPDGRPSGKRDVRHTYLAIASRYILGDTDANDMNIQALTNFIYDSQSFDGGIGETSSREAHGGFAYCAVVSLILLNEITPGSASQHTVRSQQFVNNLTKWMISRQLYYEDPEDIIDSDDANDDKAEEGPAQMNGTNISSEQGIDRSSIEHSSTERWIGFDGRANKPADSCYSFWVGGTISLLGLDDMIDQREHRRFLLERMEHRFGGFGKTPGDLPDILHSFLGLVTLSIMGQTGLQPADVTFCMTRSARVRLETLAKGREVK